MNCQILLSGQVLVIAIETVIVCSLSFTVDLAKIGVGADILPRQSDRVMNGSRHRPPPPELPT